LKIHTFISSYLESNNYLIEITPNTYIGIDVGVGVAPKICEILEKSGADLVGYFLTHAHADYTAGIQDIVDRYQVPVYCSQECKDDLNNSKRNLSFYTDEIETYSFDMNCQVLSDVAIISLGDTQVRSYHVPGHSTGWMAYLVNEVLFTGDFLMKVSKPPLHFP
jgi:hydroxyacylglutathione hydrolase